jgi:hypothetical protein
VPRAWSRAAARSSTSTFATQRGSFLLRSR